MIVTHRKNEHIGEPTKEQVGQQLSRILESEELKIPPRAKALLTFVVDEAIAGRGRYLKAFTIATEIFGRGASFDAQNDPCVRIEAARARCGLERYYLVSGLGDPVEITIPKGTYRPVFALRTQVNRTLCETASEPYPETEKRWYEQVLNKISCVENRGRNVAFGAGATIVISVIALGLALQARTGSQGLEGNGSRPFVVVRSFSEDDAGSRALLDPLTDDFRDELILHLASHRQITIAIESLNVENSVAEAYTLESAVRRDKEAFRLSARLVRNIDGVVIWAGTDYQPRGNQGHATESAAQRFALVIANRLTQASGLPPEIAQP